MSMLMEAEFWVAIAFVIFIGLLLYVGVHKTVVGSLDERQARIKSELDEAASLKRRRRPCSPNTSRRPRMPRKRRLRSSKAPRPTPSVSPPRRMPSLRTLSLAAPRWRRPRSRRPSTQALADVRGVGRRGCRRCGREGACRAAKGAVGGQLIARGIDDVKKKLN